MMENCIETRNLTKRFAKLTAVNSITLNIAKGKAYAYLGRNGAGKTTTIKMISGIMRPDSGESKVLGVPSTNLTPALFQKIGYVSENQELYPWMKTSEIIAFTSKLYSSWDKSFEQALMKKMELDPDRKIVHCSRGETVKLKLLLALCTHPELLILDEPFSGLDSSAQEEFIESLLEITRQNEWTLFFSTHSIYEVEKLADQVIILEKGGIIIDEPLDVLQERFRKITLLFTDNPQSFVLPKNAIAVKKENTSVSFVHQNFTPEEERALSALYPRAKIDIQNLSLNDIFITVTRRQSHEE
jgi:ABC-2 type transport system ATP-binding protein